MTLVALYASGMNYGAALVAAAIVIGVTTRLAFLLRQGKSVFPRRH